MVLPHAISPEQIFISTFESRKFGSKGWENSCNEFRKVFWSFWPAAIILSDYLLCFIFSTRFCSLRMSKSIIKSLKTGKLLGQSCTDLGFFVTAIMPSGPLTYCMYVLSIIMSLQISFPNPSWWSKICWLFKNEYKICRGSISIFLR